MFKRKTYLWLNLVLLLFSSSAFSQVSDYRWSYSASGIYIPLADTQRVELPRRNAYDFSHYRGIQLPFQFVFDGVTYSQINIAPNGYIVFGNEPYSLGQYQDWNSARNGSGFAITGQNQLYNLIAGHNLYLYFPPATGRLYYGSRVVFGNREFVVEYKNVTASSNTEDRINFQIILKEGTNLIQVKYGSTSYFMNNSRVEDFAQVGLKGVVSQDRLVLKGPNWRNPRREDTAFQSFECSPTSSPINGSSFTFTPPSRRAKDIALKKIIMNDSSDYDTLQTVYARVLNNGSAEIDTIYTKLKSNSQVYFDTLVLGNPIRPFEIRNVLINDNLRFNLPTYNQIELEVTLPREIDSAKNNSTLQLRYEACPPIKSFPYREDFLTTIRPPGWLTTRTSDTVRKWSFKYQNLTTSAIPTPIVTNGRDTIGVAFLRNYSLRSVHNNMLVTPRFDLNQLSAFDSVIFTFAMRTDNVAPSYVDTLEVLIDTTESFTRPYIAKKCARINPTLSIPLWAFHTIHIPQAFRSAKTRIAFRKKGIRSFDLYIDYLQVYGNRLDIESQTGSNSKRLVFNNPVEHNLAIKDEGLLTITSINGKVVYQKQINNEDLDITFLSKGIYVLNLIDSRGSVKRARMVKL